MATMVSRLRTAAVCLLPATLMLLLAYYASAYDCTTYNGKKLSNGKIQWMPPQEYDVSSIPGANPTAWQPSNFARSTLVNAGEDCRRGGINNPGANHDDHACSCYLYAECTSPGGQCAKSTDAYVTNPSPISSPHTLALPRNPCSGVEKYLTSNCGGEAIWDYAVNMLKLAGRPYGAWGAAINPVHKREQHQMSIHLARLWPELTDAISKAVTHFAPQAKWEIQCSKQLNFMKCQLQRGGNIAGTWFDGPVTPSTIKPFATVYGSSWSDMTNKHPALRNATIVVPLGNKLVLLTRTDLPAECFFDTSKSPDLNVNC